MATSLWFTPHDNQAVMYVIVCIHTAKNHLHKKLSLTPQQCMMFSQIEQTDAGERGQEQKKGHTAPFLLSWAARFPQEFLNLELDLHNTM